MKICIIVPNLLPVPCVKGGAIERLVTDIIDQNEIDNKLDITIASIYDEKAKIESKKYNNTEFIYIKKDLQYIITGIWVRICNLFGKKLNTYNQMVLKKIKNEKFDYIIVESGAYKCFRTYLKYFDKNKMIVHFHFNGKSDIETDKTYSTYIGVSEFVSNTFRKTSNIKDIVVLKNGINIDKFIKSVAEEEKKEIRKKLGFSDNDFVVIFCGRLIKEKGVLELIKAIKNIENNNIKLMIVGSINFGNEGTSHYLLELNKEINDSNDRIKLTGYIDNNDLYKYYQSADLGVIPSIWEDAAPLVVCEVMINRIPLIVTKSGGAPEYISKDTVVIEKDNNLIENLSNEIINLYKDESKRKLMAEEGYEHAKQFSTKNFYNNFVNILKRKAEENE